MKRTPMPVVAGVLEIVSGVLSLIGFATLVIASVAIGTTAVDITGWVPGLDLAFGLVVFFAVASLAVGVVAVVGGVFALQRRQWGWALAGSICSLAPSLVMGVAAVVLTALSRDEMES